SRRRDLGCVTSVEDLVDLSGERKTRIGALGAVEDVLQLLHLGGGELARVDGQRGRRLVLLAVDGTHLDRGRGELPAERHRLGRVVHRGVAALRRCRETTVDEVQLVSVIRTLGVVTDPSTVRETEGTTRLPTEGETVDRRSRAVALLELVRVGERLDGGVELLGRDQVEVHLVVRALLVGLGARGALGTAGKTVPGHTGVVLTLHVREVEDTVIDAGLVDLLAGLVPGKLTHSASPRSRL